MTMRPRNVYEYRTLARKRLPRAFFEFMDRGSEDEFVLRDNRSAFDALKLTSKVLVDVSQSDTSVELFGAKIAAPLIIAPTGLADMMSYQGEIALAKAASAARVPFVLTTSSTIPLEVIASYATSGFWLQHYVWDNRAASREVIARAHDAGADALMLTVDSPVFPKREYNDHNGFSSPPTFNARLAMDIAMHPRWFCSVLFRYLISGGMPRFVNHPASVGDQIVGRKTFLPTSKSVTWRDMDDFRKLWQRPLIVKGILNRADARLAVDHGMDGIVVSNHGGRTSDSFPASLDVLSGIVDAVGTEVTVLFDGGIRRGSDIAKALCLGARAVMAGRSPLYGVAADGENGALDVLSLLVDELGRTMAYMGASKVAEIGPANLVLPSVRK